MENQLQQSNNIYFDKISALMKAENGKDKKINAINIEKISVKEYELLGSVAYLLGLDFTSQRETLVWSTLQKVNKRLTDNNITKADYVALVDFLRKLNFTALDEPKEAMKNNIIKPIGNSVENTIIINSIRTILKASSVMVQFSVDTEKMMQNKNGLTFTYHNALMFNTLFYDQIDLDANCLPNVKTLLMNENFGKILTKASDYFDMQKYAIIYFDSLHTVFEFLTLHENCADLLFNDDLIEELRLKEEADEALTGNQEGDSVDAIIEQGPKEANSEEFTIEEFEVDNTDYFFRSALMENIMRPFKSPEDILEALATTMENEDLMQHFYKFVKARGTMNRQPFVEVYPDVNYEEFMLKLEEIVTTENGNYKTLVEKYAAEIPADIRNKVVALLHETIKSLILDNKDAKAYLIQEIVESQVTTYKQLHQTISLIENCKIKISKLDTYVALRDYIEKTNSIEEIFAEASKLETIVNKIKFYDGIRDFYDFDNKVAKQKAAENQTIAE